MNANTLPSDKVVCVCVCAKLFAVAVLFWEAWEAWEGLVAIPHVFAPPTCCCVLPVKLAKWKVTFPTADVNGQTYSELAGAQFDVRR